MCMLFLSIVSMLAGMATAAEPSILTSKVVSVHDGDTLRVLDAGGTLGTVDVAGRQGTATEESEGRRD
jgi:endonuclease YncB( thermonuclease family)